MSLFVCKKWNEVILGYREIRRIYLKDRGEFEIVISEPAAFLHVLEIAHSRFAYISFRIENGVCRFADACGICYMQCDFPCLVKGRDDGTIFSVSIADLKNCLYGVQIEPTLVISRKRFGRLVTISTLELTDIIPQWHIQNYPPFDIPVLCPMKHLYTLEIKVPFLKQYFFRVKQHYEKMVVLSLLRIIWS